MIVLLPGVARSARLLAGWSVDVPGLHVLDLPGQGGTSPLPVQTVEAMVEHFAALIPKSVFVVGESLGGLVAIGLANRGFRVLAIDPPLATEPSAGMATELRRVMANLGSDHPFREFVFNTLGVSESAAEPRDYWSMVEGLTAPVDILTGTPADCLISASDRLRLARQPLMRLYEVRGDHTLLQSNPAACKRLIVRLGDDGERAAAGEAVDRVLAGGGDRPAGREK